ncbi:MAG: hypothetical protein HY551_04615, partial [Elusimicrobia bacterium]|nr:hypothetical protein [Elusimicrobiota bacterium]
TDWAARLENLLERSKKRGDLSASLDSKAWAETVLALYEGTVMLAKTRRDPEIFRRVGRIATELLRGCARHKNKRKGG